MIADRTDRSTAGTWVLALAAALGTTVALYEDVTPGTGIDHTYGALLVVASSALLLIAALVLLLFRWPRAARGVLLALLLLGIAGTAFAAYFLEAHVLLALMALAVFGWLIRAVSGPPATVVHSSSLLTTEPQR